MTRVLDAASLDARQRVPSVEATDVTEAKQMQKIPREYNYTGSSDNIGDSG